MGNIICGNERYCNKVKLGDIATIDMTRQGVKIEDGEGYKQRWTVSYTITELDTNCTLSLEKIVDQQHCLSDLKLKLVDEAIFACDATIGIGIQRVPQTNFLDVDCDYEKPYFKEMVILKPNDTTNTTTRVFSYRTLMSKRGLVILELKKKSRYDEKPYAATIAHYYAVKRDDFFVNNNIDVGLSMVVNIQVSNNKLDLTVLGPNRHPSPALLYMFDQLPRTGSWACPHCAKRQSKSDSSESESSDSESESESEDTGNGLRRLPPQLHATGQQNGSGGHFLANKGRVRGNYNGSFFVRNFIFGGGFSFEK